MKVLIGCPWWGLDHLGIEKMLQTISLWGYDAVETGIPESSKEQLLLRKALKDTGLKLVAHQYRAEGEKLENYLVSLQKWLTISAELDPICINSHSGRDYWSFSDNSKVVTPEFGPLPYMWPDPISGKPIEKHSEINLIMKQIIKDKILTKREMK